MKRVLVTALAVLALAFAFTGSAEAKCGPSCLGRKVSSLSAGLKRAQRTIESLDQTVVQLEQKVSGQAQTIASQANAISSQGKAIASQGKELEALYGCLYELPVTQYGDAKDETEGYVYDNGTTTVETTALDATHAGDPIDSWVLFDACNSQEAMPARLSAGAPGLAPRAVFPALPALP